MTRSKMSVNSSQLFGLVFTLSVVCLVALHLSDLFSSPTVSAESKKDSQVRMPPCPDSSPKLTGPLNVDFTGRRNLDGVRREVGEHLRQGGRHKPPDCVSKHKVAVVIPFRNRHDNLTFTPILVRQQLDYGVYVIDQDGESLFNRAKLLSVGFFVFSDVDIVPMDDRNLYGCFDNPRHFAIALDKYGLKLPYVAYFGGVLAMTKEQYLKTNVFANKEILIMRRIH